MPNDATTTPADMQASLANLEALSSGLEKAYGGVKIDNSGTMGSEGKQGGGQAGASDVGGTESLMIGKLVDAGALVPTAGIVGFMGDDPGAYGSGRMAGFLTGYQHGKAGKEMEEGDGNGEDFSDGYKKGYLAANPGEPAFKSETYDDGESLYDYLRKSEETSAALDASAFVEDLARGVSEALDSMRKSIASRDSDQARVNQVLIEALGQLAKSQTAVAPVIQELGNRLEIVERTPAQPKGARTVTQAKALAKSIPGEAGNGPEGEPLSKSEVVSTLSYLNLVKGQRQINGTPTYQLVGLAEAGDVLDDTTMDHVRQFLAKNPEEAAQAKAYH